MKPDLQSSQARGRGVATWLISSTLCLAAVGSHGQIIPANRLTTWTPGVTIGVPGGIPTTRTNLIDVTQAPYSADNTGVNDASTAIQAAINAAPANGVVYLPAGTYRTNAVISIPYSKTGITLRGSGNSTIIKPNGTFTYILNVNNDNGWTYPSTGNTVTAGLSKGSTNVTIADTSAFAVGKMIQFGTGNDPSIPIMSVNGYDLLPTLQPNRRQVCRITAMTPTTLTFFPPLYDDYSATPVIVNVAFFQGQSVGIENLWIDCTNSTGAFAICLQQCYSCWIKGVKVSQCANYPVFVVDSLNCEVRDCDIGPLNHTGSNGSGILVNTDSGCLFENNVIIGCGPSIEVNFGSSGNVFGYNYCTNTTGVGFIDSNHAPHNDFNLYEGNIADNFMADGYFGSVASDTLFRNWITGQNTGATANTVGWCIGLKRFTRNYSLVGNLVGTPGYTMVDQGVSYGQPNLGNSFSTGFGPPWSTNVQTGAGTMTQNGTSVTTTQPMFSAASVGWQILVLSGPNIGHEEYITAYTDPTDVTVGISMTVSAAGYRLAPSQTGYQELDQNVQTTTLLAGNYNYHDNAIPSSQALGTNTLPTSLYRTGTPSWFGNLTWPPFDPTNPAPTMNSIPASYRYANGAPPPGATGTPPPPPTNLIIINSSGS